MAERTAIAVDIVMTPLGEAPEWVRRAWVGLRLPLIPGHARRRWQCVGMLTGPHNWFAQVLLTLIGRTTTTDGYLVDRDAAFEVLGRHSPEALAWWRETEIGKRRGGGFIFDAPACAPVYAD